MISNLLAIYLFANLPIYQVAAINWLAATCLNNNKCFHFMTQFGSVEYFSSSFVVVSIDSSNNVDDDEGEDDDYLLAPEQQEFVSLLLFLCSLKEGNR